MRNNEIKTTLNVRSPALAGLSSYSGDNTIQQAVASRMLHKETYEDAWARVLSMKNSEKDNERLLEVKAAMDAGTIGRATDKASKKFSKSEALALHAQIAEQKRLDILADMVDNMPDSYELVTDKARLDEVVEELSQEMEVVFDVETTGVDVYSDIIVGHVLSATSKDRHYYIPTDHNDSTTQLPREYVAEKLRPIYESETIGLIAHNAKFDMQMLRNDPGIKVRGLLWDTQEAMKLLNENEPTYALKPLVTKYLKDQSYTYGQLFGDAPFSDVDLRTALAYAAKDGDVTYRLYKFQQAQMARVGNLLDYFLMVEMPLMSVVSDIELRGYDIDTEYAGEVAEDLRGRTNELKAVIEEELSRYHSGDDPINIASPTQLRAVITNMTGKAVDSADKSTLKRLGKEYDVFIQLLKYRDMTKLLSTYYDALPQLVQERTGRIHTRLHQNGAKTGRFSSGGSGSFNIQNQSPEARKMFIAPPGKLIVNADFKAQEVRIIASESQEEVLLDAFARGVDAYATLASEFFGKPYDECYKQSDGSDTPERKKMKVVLLMSMYGASKFGLAEALGISASEAEKFLADFFAKYRKIDAFINETHEYAKKHGYVWIGDKYRKRRLPEARLKREFIPQGKWGDDKYEKARRQNGLISQAMRQGPNARIQGLAALQTKATMLEMEKLCKRKGWELFAPVHDEIVLYTYENMTADDFKEIEQVMTNSFLLKGVDNGTDIEVQKAWGDAVTSDDYLRGVRKW